MMSYKSEILEPNLFLISLKLNKTKINQNFKDKMQWKIQKCFFIRNNNDTKMNFLFMLKIIKKNSCFYLFVEDVSILIFNG